MTWQFCFGAVPYTVQGHDCRSIFAAAAARVHAIGVLMREVAAASLTAGRTPGCSCAPTQAVVPRRSSAAIAIGAMFIVLIVRHTRAGGHCMRRGDAIRRAIVAGSNMRSDHAATGRGKIK